MIKPTKRKAFNFLRSYFDVLNELKTDADKLNFLLAIINKQFLDENPKGLEFVANLCYESQRHSIESSVKGWERATNNTLLTTPPTTPPTNPKEVEEKEEEEVKEEEKEQGVETLIYPTFDDFWELYNKKIDRSKCIKKWTAISQKEKELIMIYIPIYIIHQPEKKFRRNPETFINNKTWENEIIQTEQKSNLLQISELGNDLLDEQGNLKNDRTTEIT